MNEYSAPKVFISYSWDSDDHKKWVYDFATRLRNDGIDVTFDQWHAAPGDQLPRFMETAVREKDFVLIVCTPQYKLKSDKDKGGVGYESNIMTGEVWEFRNHKKFIPIHREGDWASAAPSWLTPSYRIDLTGNPYSAASYHDLLLTLHGKRPVAPPIGPPPELGSDREKLLAVAIDILNMANRILESNQSVLLPLFQNPDLRYAVGQQLTGLYQLQQHRGDFGQWRALLEECTSQTNDSLAQSTGTRLRNEVQHLHQAFYNYDRSVADKGEAETTKHFVELVLGNNIADPRWYNLADSEVSRIAESYLDSVRRSVETIGTVIGQLRAAR